MTEQVPKKVNSSTPAFQLQNLTSPYFTAESTEDTEFLYVKFEPTLFKGEKDSFLKSFTGTLNILNSVIEIMDNKQIDKVYKIFKFS